MRDSEKNSEKKQNLVNDFLKTTLQDGELIYVSDELCASSYEFHKNDTYEIITIDGDELTICRSGYSENEKHKKINIKDVKTRRGIWDVGADPFNRKYQSIRPVAYNMESIIFTLELAEKRREKPYIIEGVIAKEVNWNPFVYNKDGEKEFYQRDFVWTEKEEHLLIDSIYKGISCGTILVRKREWKELEKLAKKGETEIAFTDIIDGKQRLNTIRKFMNNEITDKYGNYYADLSNHAQHSFTSHQLFSYAEMNSASDDDVIFQFLKLNHAGIPQSQEHIDFVTDILGKM